MEDAFSFFSREGIPGPRSCSLHGAAVLGPYATVADVAALTDLSVYSAPDEEATACLLEARRRAREECGFNLELGGPGRCSFTSHKHSDVGGAPGREGRSYAECLRSARVSTSPCLELTALEHIAMGHEVSAFEVAGSFQWVFQESSTLRDRRPTSRKLFSFEERCRASGCEFLIPASSIDEDRVDRCARPAAPPARRIQQAQASLSRRERSPRRHDPEARRLPLHLQMEASLRTQMRSVKGSWRCVRSGIFSYALFMHSTMPQVAHFPVPIAALRLWANSFDNGDTLSQYVSHLRFAHRLLGMPCLPDPEVIASIIRGTRKDQVRRPKPRAEGDSLYRLIMLAIGENDVTAARAYAVAYSFLFRCHNELFGLQIDGRRSGERHHSHIEWVRPEDSAQPPSVSVHLRSRKNSPKGEVVSRPCVCRKRLPSFRCGYCSLRALVRNHLDQGKDRSEPLLHSLKARAALENLRRRGALAGIERCSWHAFRRGAASDIINSGGTLGFLLHQGGWRSGAFLKYILRRDLEHQQTLRQAARGLDSDSD